MTEYFIQVNSQNSHILMVCGVTGVGKRSFIQAFFAQASFALRKKATKLKVNEVSVIVLLDGIHSNNLAEDELLGELAHWRRLNPHIQCRFLFLVNKLDLFVGIENFILLRDAMRQEYETMTATHNIECDNFALTSVKCIRLLLEISQGNEIDELLAMDLARTLKRIAPEHIKKSHTYAHFSGLISRNINLFFDRIGANEITSFLAPLTKKNAINSNMTRRKKCNLS